MIGNSSNVNVEDEGFAIGEMLIGMIADTEQRRGVAIIREEDEGVTELATDIWENDDVEEEAENSC